MYRSVRKRRMDAMRRNEEMRQNAVVIDYTDFKAAAGLRKELPEYVVVRIKECIDEIRARYPWIKELKLIGSYSNGTYVDENTTDEFKALKDGVQRKVKTSDFDFEPTPFISGTFQTKNGYTVHLWKAYDNNEGFVIWQE